MTCLPLVMDAIHRLEHSPLRLHLVYSLARQQPRARPIQQLQTAPVLLSTPSSSRNLGTNRSERGRLTILRKTGEGHANQCSAPRSGFREHAACGKRLRNAVTCAEDPDPDIERTSRVQLCHSSNQHLKDVARSTRRFLEVVDTQRKPLQTANAHGENGRTQPLRGGAAGVTQRARERQQFHVLALAARAHTHSAVLNGSGCI